MSRTKAGRVRSRGSGAGVARRAVRVSRPQRRPRSSSPTVAEVLGALDAIAPFRLAAEWDNVGLLVGHPDWPARKWLLAIDLTDAVADEALRGDVNGLVVYHPPIFKGIRAVTPAADAPTTRLPDLLAQRTSIIAMHTALDAADGGTNDVLLEPFDVVDVRPLEPVAEPDRQYKLVVFVPQAEVASLRAALSQAGAGVIGHYDQCSYELRGRGTFRGDETTRPTIGRRLQLETVDEVRLEMVAPAARLADVVRCIYEKHSYEEPAFDLYPLHALADGARAGMGRIARMRTPMRGTQIIEALGSIADLSGATVVGDPSGSFQSLTVGAGAFGVRAFRDPDSFVITGEFKHHDALALLRSGVTALCLGHYASERPVLEPLRRLLAKRVQGLSLAIARADRTPFQPVRKQVRSR